MNYDEYIESHNFKEVKSSRLETKNERFDPDGLFSEEIFGRLGSPQRRTLFGFINLKTKIIHPEAWNIVLSLNSVIGKIVTGKKKYLIDSATGDLVEDEDEYGFGWTGVSGLIEHWDELNIDVLGKQKPEIVKFLKKYRDVIFTDKYLVLPAGLRDIQTSKMSGKTIMVSSEVNTLYQDLISNTRSFSEYMTDDIIVSLTASIQRKVLEINEWILQRLKGKGGVVRGGLLSKTVDYTGRFPIVGDKNMPLGYIGLPWQSILKLYGPFTEFQLLKNSANLDVLEMIKKYLGLENKIDSTDIKRFCIMINEHPETVNPLLKEELIRIANEIVSDKVVIYKRDPVESRTSYLAGYIKVLNDGFCMKISPLDTVRTGADFDGGAQRF